MVQGCENWPEGRAQCPRKHLNRRRDYENELMSFKPQEFRTNNTYQFKQVICSLGYSGSGLYIGLKF